MIATLTGVLRAKGASAALIDVAGVGYRVSMSTSSLAVLPAEGDVVTVHTHLHVREDELSLFGFVTEEECTLFEQLITVSGVGPKVALAILSSLRPDDLRGAIAREDTTLLSSVPGIGKKTAQRLVIDLKDRLELPDLGPTARAAGGEESQVRDALVSMGFTSAEATAALRDAPAGSSAEELLKHALKALGGAG